MVIKEPVGVCVRSPDSERLDQVARLHAKAPRQIVKALSTEPSSLETHANSAKQLPNNSTAENVRAVTAVDKQIQTKGKMINGNGKMHQQLQLKTEEVKAPATVHFVC
ncbi:hypothetical protein PI124_g20694 [Phytophthora idaei]|nr:hypothetical protein PI124_g20694 [Phytophthora idaei]